MQQTLAGSGAVWSNSEHCGVQPLSRSTTAANASICSVFVEFAEGSAVDGGGGGHERRGCVRDGERGCVGRRGGGYGGRGAPDAEEPPFRSTRRGRRCPTSGSRTQTKPKEDVAFLASGSEESRDGWVSPACVGCYGVLQAQESWAPLPCPAPSGGRLWIHKQGRQNERQWRCQFHLEATTHRN